MALFAHFAGFSRFLTAFVVALLSGFHSGFAAGLLFVGRTNGGDGCEGKRANSEGQYNSFHIFLFLADSTSAFWVGLLLLFVFLGMALFTDLAVVASFDATLMVAFLASFGSSFATTCEHIAGTEGQGNRGQHQRFH